MFSKVRGGLLLVAMVVGATTGLLAGCSSDTLGYCFGVLSNEGTYSAADVTESTCKDACPDCSWSPNSDV